MADKTDPAKESVVIKEDIFKKLVKKGEKAGFLSFAEVNNAISDDLKSSDQLEDVLVQFKEHGIELRDMEKPKKTKEKSRIKPTKKHIAKERSKKSSSMDEDTEKRDLTATRKERSDLEFGAVTDPVKMYLKEMGMVTLLSREGEIEIAKKIEMGERDMLRAMLDCPFSLDTIFTYGDKMERKWHPPQTCFKRCG